MYTIEILVYESAGKRPRVDLCRERKRRKKERKKNSRIVIPFIVRPRTVLFLTLVMNR